MRQLHWILFSITILSLGFVWMLFSRAAPETTTEGFIPSPFIGFSAPDFTLPNSMQEEVTLSDLRGKPILVNFWASWCLPCRTEMPAIQEIYQEYAPQGLSVLAINATNQDEYSAVKSFINQNGLTFPILFDENGQVSASYRIQSLPTTFFIDQDGVIQDIAVGGMSETFLRIKIEELISGTSKETD